MTKKELVRELRERVAERLPKPGWAKQEVIEACVEELLSLVKEKVLSGEEVKIREFGKFYLRNTKPRSGYDVSTGKRVRIPARKRFYFEPSKKIKFIGGE